MNTLSDGTVKKLRMFDNPFWGDGTKVCPVCGGADQFQFRLGDYGLVYRLYPVLVGFAGYDEWACEACGLIGITTYDRAFDAALTLAAEVNETGRGATT